MRINVYGMGYVGCVSAACLAKKGHHVTGIDIDEEKVSIINSGRSPIVEEGLEELIGDVVASGNLRATTDEIPGADVSFVCVGTPSRENGSLDLRHIQKVASDIGEALSRNSSYHVVIVRSTVLPGTTENVIVPILEKTSGKKAGVDFGVCMNPEFMREGSSIHDFYNPPFTVIGELDEKSGDVVEKLYGEIKAELVRTEIKVAELIKYACNLFHALKISFANEIGNICKKLGINSHEVMDIFCKDRKLNISGYYLRPGFAFGGSCLPKDLRAVLYLAKEIDLEIPLLQSILPANRRQIDVAFDLIRKNGGKKVGICGLSFKSGTDDLRESPLVELTERLIGKGYDVKIYDPEVSLARIRGANRRYIVEVIPHISSLLKNSVSEAFDNVDIIVIGKRNDEVVEYIKHNGRDLQVIDLINVKLEDVNSLAGYEGICW